MEIIGREHEKRIFRQLESSGKPEFVVVYGRRRIGKTFLITRYFNNNFSFSTTGVSDGSLKDQLRVFHMSLKKHYQSNIPLPKDWFHAFNLLEEQIEKDITQGRKVLFIDEMPWFDTPKSNFLSALEHFWNAFASKRKDILLIVCGSAASWIVKNLINNYGGLHNRVTDVIFLEPFNLKECEAFYQNRGIAMNREQIAEAYMILGGIPFYMDAMDKAFGLNQNIDLLLFNKNAKLSNEYARLYNSLFRHANNHMRIAEVLSKTNMGMSRKELSEKSGISDGGGLTKILDEMESCGLISKNHSFSKNKYGGYYKLIDFYTLFYYKFIKTRKSNDPHFWTNFLSYPAHRIWCGYAFERLCAAHINQIKYKLGIYGVISDIYTFRSVKKKGGAQIDIIIDRKDDVINLVECKFSGLPYKLTAECIKELEHKKNVFIEETKTKKAIHITMITVSGLVVNEHYNAIQSEVTLNDLFL